MPTSSVCVMDHMYNIATYLFLLDRRQLLVFNSNSLFGHASQDVAIPMVTIAGEGTFPAIKPVPGYPA